MAKKYTKYILWKYENIPTNKISEKEKLNVNSDEKIDLLFKKRTFSINYKLGIGLLTIGGFIRKREQGIKQQDIWHNVKDDVLKGSKFLPRALFISKREIIGKKGNYLGEGFDYKDYDFEFTGTLKKITKEHTDEEKAYIPIRVFNTKTGATRTEILTIIVYKGTIWSLIKNTIFRKRKHTTK